MPTASPAILIKVYVLFRRKFRMLTRRKFLNMNGVVGLTLPEVVALRASLL